MDLASWLKDLGLDRYVEAFRANAVDRTVLLDLTADDLRDLGITAVGHRRKLLSAIAGMKVHSTRPDVPTAPIFSDKAVERRQLTVLFCDLVGSTSLSRRLDPEDMSDIIRRFQSVVAQAVGCFDGYLAKLMGDGALVYFGYPTAHEDDPERAVRASLAILDAIASAPSDGDTALAARIGIATGIVVVGEIMGEGEARERSVVGDAPNLAARLQAIAAPGQVVVSDTTHRLLRNAFTVGDLGRHALKGIADPVQAWSVEREADHVSRFEAARPTGRTPFVGRDLELSMLADRWRTATEGEGQVLLLSGEAGIGKSRIVHAFRARIAAAPQATLLFQCSPHRSNDAFFPIVGQLRRSARLVAGEPDAVSLAKLDAMLPCDDLDRASIVPALAALLTIPLRDGDPVPDLPPSERKERLIATLTALFARLARSGPVLALLEDAHWIDPSSRDAFGRLIASLARLPALLVVTARPEFQSTWASHPHVTTYGLNHLGRRQVLAMIGGVSGGTVLPEWLRDAIAEKTDGVPLFVEELTKAVLESGAAESPVAIPSTLHDSLMARLDRLGPVKEVAQVAAAIGRDFSFRLLAAILPDREAELRAALVALEAAGLVHGHGTLPNARFAFKHVLVQNAASASLLRGTRQRIHADIARVLEDPRLAGERVSPAVVAHHHAEAGAWAQAGRAWLAAAEAALARSANTEAGRYADAALGLLPHLPDGEERRTLALALHLARTNALMISEGIGAKETMTSLVEAECLLSRHGGDDLQRLFVLYSRGLVDYIEARMGPALDLARRYFAIAERQPDPTYRMVGNLQVGTVLLLRGDLDEALMRFEAAEALQSTAQQKQLGYRFVWEPSLAVACLKRWTLLSLGRLDEAQRMGEALQAQETSHRFPYAAAYRSYLGIVLPASMLGDLETCERHSAELVAFCDAAGVHEFAHQGRLRHACTRALRDPSPAHIAELPTALGSHWSSAHVSDSYNLSQHAEVLLRAGDLAGAEAILARAFDFVALSEERHWLSDLHVLAGRLERARTVPDLDAAEARFETAVGIARRQTARLAELRAATQLGQIWRNRGQDIRPLLAPLLETIKGGAHARDVRRARRMLAGDGPSGSS